MNMTANAAETAGRVFVDSQIVIACAPRFEDDMVKSRCNGVDTTGEPVPLPHKPVYVAVGVQVSS